jgi:murein L,D-transpeptidase YafK
VAEMSNLKNLSKKEEDLSFKELEARNNYNNMVMSNYKPPLDIEERMKKLKFAKKENIPTQSDWFSKF